MTFAGQCSSEGVVVEVVKVVKVVVVVAVMLLLLPMGCGRRGGAKRAGWLL